MILRSYSFEGAKLMMHSTPLLSITSWFSELFPAKQEVSLEYSARPLRWWIAFTNFFVEDEGLKLLRLKHETINV